MSPSKAHPTFKVTDRTDRELLAIIADIHDDAVTAADIAQALNINTNGNKNQTPAKAIAPRLGSMRTVGLIDRRPEKQTDDSGAPFKTNVWFITEKGKQILSGKLAKSVDAQLGRMNPGQQLLVMQRVVQAGYREGDRTTALTLRRQWQYEQAQRKVPFRA